MGVLMNRENWLKNIEGAVFDLDGTLLDSSWVWEKVDEKFLGDRGFQVPDDYVDEISPLGAERAAVLLKLNFKSKKIQKELQM